MKDGKEGENMEKPLVSVIIPAYNCSQYIKRAIHSVLIQAVPVEIIVVDDCSSDNLEEKLRLSSYWEQVIYIRNDRNMGVAFSRNRGVRLAQADYIAYLDGDDWWRKGKLKSQLALIKEKKAVLTYTGRQLAREDGHLLSQVLPVSHRLDYKKLLYHNQIPCSSVVASRQLVLQNPMRRSDLHEDFLQWLSILRHNHVAYGINRPYLVSRLTGSGKSRNKWKSFYMTYGVYREMGIGRALALWYTGWHLAHGIWKYWGKGKIR